MAQRTQAVRSDGVRSREAILGTAMRLASVEGLEGLSIGNLATAVGMSKGGVYAHFDSKEDLQLAVVRAAREVFVTEIVLPALRSESPLDQLRRLVEGFLRYVEDRVFPGGCFFVSAAAEFGSRPGAVRDEIAASQRDWSRLLCEVGQRACVAGELRSNVDPEQLAFELGALLAGANLTFVLHDDDSLVARARSAAEALLSNAATDSAARREARSGRHPSPGRRARGRQSREHQPADG